MASRQLPVGRSDLPARQPTAARAAAAGARQAAAARALGHDAGAELPLRAHEPRHPAARPRRYLHRRPGSRRPGGGGRHVAGGHLQRGVLPHHARRGRHARPVPPVLVPGRHPEPRRAGDARVDPRGRGARLCAHARLRRRLRQPGPRGAVRGRRRRGRDGPAGRELALEQVPQPGRRRRRAAGAAPQRLQDRQSDRARADPRRRAGGAHGGIRAPADLRRGQRARGDAPPDGGGARRGARRHRGDPPPRARGGTARASALAADRAALAEGLDRPGRGHDRLAPGPAGRSCASAPSTSPSSRRGCAPTGRRSCSTSTGRRATTCWPRRPRDHGG